MSFKNCSTNEYTNEFAVILKLINFKNGKLKIEIFKIFKFNGYKNSHSRSNLNLFQVHLRNSQKV